MAGRCVGEEAGNDGVNNEDNNGEVRVTPASECPSGVYSQRGICRPEAPRLTDPQGCPGAIDDHGLCLPLPPDSHQCPDGWRPERLLSDRQNLELEALGLEPPAPCRPPTPPDTCPEGLMPLVGRAGCVPIGLSCPEGELWHDEATLRSRAPGFDGAILYVAPPSDGPPTDPPDGARLRPFNDLGAALASAQPGDIVAIGVGLFEGVVEPGDGVALIGACPSGSRLTTTERREYGATVSLSGTRGVLLSDLHVSGAGWGVLLDRAQETTLRALWIQGATGLGLLASASDATGGDLWITDTAPEPNGELGRGVHVEQRARIVLERVSLTHNRQAGISLLHAGSAAELRQAFIGHTRPQAADQTMGVGALVAQGATLRLEQAALPGNHVMGLWVYGPGSSVEALDVEIGPILPAPGSAPGGLGMMASDQARLTARRAVIHDGLEAGLHATSGAQMTLSDAVVAHFDEENFQNVLKGSCARIFSASLSLTRVGLHDCLSDGIDSGAPGANLALEDVTISHIQPFVDSRPFMTSNDRGLGLSFVNGQRLTFKRLALVHNHTTGLEFRSGEVVQGSDLLIAHTQPDARTGNYGNGLVTAGGGQLHLERAVFLRNHASALQLAPYFEQEVALTDLYVAETQPRRTSNTHGRGLEIQGPTPVVVRRAVFIDNTDVGVLAFDEGTTLRLEDVQIGRTRESAPVGQRAPIGGIGLAPLVGARIEATRFEIFDHPLTGVLLARRGVIEGLDGTISDNFVGVNAQNEGFDFDASFERVAIHDNCCGDCGVQVCNIERIEVPVPEVPDLRPPR